MLKDMTPEQGDVIRSLQPYRGTGRSHPLWVLNEYARRERHRLLLLAFGIVWASKVDVPLDGTEYEKRGELPRVETVDGTCDYQSPCGWQGTRCVSSSGHLLRSICQISIPG